MKALLFQALSKNYSDENFERILVKSIQKRLVEINCLNEGGQTVLDVAEFIPGLSSKAVILRKYGAKTSRALGHIPSAIGDSIVSGYSSSSSAYNAAPTQTFDINMNGKLCVVDAFLEGEDTSLTSVAKKIDDYRRCIGIMMHNGVGIGTAFLISPTIVLVSRHCLNHTFLDELHVRFDFSNQDVAICGLLEDGAMSTGLDYAVLKIKTAVNTNYIPSLSSNREPLQFTFMGYDSEEDLCFTNYTPPQEELALVGSHQETFQETDFSFSGSPYFDENDTVYALHQNTGLNQKESLFIAEILEKYNDSILLLPKEEWDSCALIEIDDGAFPTISFSSETQYDEGWARGVTLGKNPSIKKDELGKDNLVCQEVLYRWALKGKARYVGVKADKRLWIQDWKTWEVFVKKSDSAAREWVKLSENRQNGKPAIQMGHKLSAVSYWAHGYDPVNNAILKEFFEQYETKHAAAKLDEKKLKYAARYAAFFTPGFRQVEQGQAIVNREFMYDSRNYCFEWADLNEAHGRAESKKITYEKIFDLGSQEADLGEYRTLRKDKETTPLLKEILNNRRIDLDALIATNHAKFSR